MTARRHLVVFARAPVLGQVKRRLARDIGPVAATRFYRRTLTGTVRRLSTGGRWQTWLAVTPDRSISDPGAWPAGVPRLPQGPGDLGRRMARFLAGLGPGPVVVVGSDIPEITPRDIGEAFAALGRADLTLGPSPDGGYWLIGWAGRRPLPRGALVGVRWSTAMTRDDTLATFGRRIRAAMLAVHDDIDDGAAFRALRNNKERPHG